MVNIKLRVEVASCEQQYGVISKSVVEDKCVKVVQDMYESCETVMRCAVRVTEEFKKESSTKGSRKRFSMD